MRVVPVLVVLLIALPMLSGCFGDEESDPAPKQDEVDPAVGDNVTTAPPTDDTTPPPTPVRPTQPGNDTTNPGNETDNGDPEPPAERPPITVPPPKVRADGRIEVPVRVPVFLFGFPDGTADKLHERLSPTAFDHTGYVAYQKIPPTNALSAQPAARNPIVAVAHFDVRAANPALEAAFAAFHESVRSPARIDGAAIERWLATNATDHGFTLDPDVLTLVLYHPGNDLVDKHTYRYGTEHMFLDSTRLFGEREPLLFLDLGAKANPSATGTTGYVATRYSEPIRNDDPELLVALEDAVLDATNMRILQAPLYRPATTTCHAVTLVFASRMVQMTKSDPSGTDYAKAWAEYDLPGLRVDVKKLQLPSDDPALDALTRSGPGEYDALRHWLEENWQDYWIPHADCEPYLGIFVDGDILDIPGSSSIRGAAKYDPQRTARVMLAIQPDLYAGDQYVRYLVSHEMGHLFGLAHPHDRSADGFTANAHWGTTQSVMTYMANPHVPGAADRANLLRNRAGAVVFDAKEAGYGDTREFELAMRFLHQAEWGKAAQAVLPLVNR